MKKELLLVLFSVLITIISALILTRWLAPQLYEVPAELQLVKVAKEVPPFFENVFNREALESKTFIVNDPLINRGKPLNPDLGTSGPNDLLGFRNRSIPNTADIITIGDSQTYGLTAPLEANWPSQLSQFLVNKPNKVYNMALGSWGATQYLDIFKKAVFFKPYLIIVAFYTGNDPLDSFIRVYGDSRWEDYRPNPDLSKKDAPQVTYPSKEEDFWRVGFNDGTKTVFTPRYRHASNDMTSDVVRAGYEIMVHAAKSIALLAKSHNINLLFTVIPTKEYVYSAKITNDKIVPRDDYLALVEDEKSNLNYMADTLSNISGAVYVDVAAALQKATLANETFLYPESENGHPGPQGYKVIAETLLPKVLENLPDSITGPVLIEPGRNENQEIYLVKNKELWLFNTLDLYEKNGWGLSQLQKIDNRAIENMPYAGVIYTASPEHFGPHSKYFEGL